MHAVETCKRELISPVRFCGYYFYRNISRPSTFPGIVLSVSERARGPRSHVDCAPIRRVKRVAAGCPPETRCIVFRRRCRAILFRFPPPVLHGRLTDHKSSYGKLHVVRRSASRNNFDKSCFATPAAAKHRRRCRCVSWRSRCLPPVTTTTTTAFMDRPCRDSGWRSALLRQVYGGGRALTLYLNQDNEGKGDKAWNKVEQRKGRSNILFSLLFLYVALVPFLLSPLSLFCTLSPSLLPPPPFPWLFSRV